MAHTQSHDLAHVLNAIPAREVRTTEEDAAAFPRLATFNDGAVYVGRFAGDSPWELHPDSDELLHVLEGRVEVTLLRERERVLLDVRAGSVLVVPRGVWHRQRALPSVTLLAVTPDRSETSFDTEPPSGTGGKR
jgi:quercetin dioxygenase-like cupin family protein